MKQGINITLPVTFEYDLSLVKQIDFIFRQSPRMGKQFSQESIMNGVFLKFTYPSETAKLSEVEKNTIDLYWEKQDTYKFNSEELIYLDTRIYLKDQEQNPETELVTFKISPTLFKRNE